MQVHRPSTDLPDLVPALPAERWSHLGFWSAVHQTFFRTPSQLFPPGSPRFFPPDQLSWRLCLGLVRLVLLGLAQTVAGAPFSQTLSASIHRSPYSFYLVRRSHLCRWHSHCCFHHESARHHAAGSHHGFRLVFDRAGRVAQMEKSGWMEGPETVVTMAPRPCLRRERGLNAMSSVWPVSWGRFVAGSFVCDGRLVVTFVIRVGRGDTANDCPGSLEESTA
ncbi:hypothetical protein VTO42DRAFT_5413 [Malbranchea cinnamomea]